MTTQLTYKTILLSVFSIVTMSLGAQCVDYGVWPNKTKGEQSSYNLNVKNDCDTDVYFVILAKKQDGKIHSLLKGQLKAGEKLKHKTYGPFLSSPVGQHIAVTPSNALAARKRINAFIVNAKATDSFGGELSLDEVDIAINAVAIEK